MTLFYLLKRLFCETLYIYHFDTNRSVSLWTDLCFLNLTIKHLYLLKLIMFIYTNIPQFGP